ncbi:putative AbiEii toxin of type IV toxin-antitoxin system [Mucilaginibacter gracilis]|uniref:Putative AbiEii toxin of type IV toxin-antitoxin system n=1 Tax=Mucilaginibacter gracilis TaxID=423350 RepID=A0A495ITG6_9SPHI|nr:AAA family ATPase [Mucilaginibacter gracilis]RKR80075.1 putative AbiEii toxin of type IV toxin-antitoxin system [Mucilaginibacter gracilis]
MRYLRLYEPRTVNEYYKDNLEAHFLGNIKELNIIVGANNSRKSRFLRRVIELELKAVFESNFDLNQAYINSQQIFDEIAGIPGLSINTQLAYLIFPQGAGTNGDYKAVKDYVTDEAGNSNIIDFAKLQNSLKNINETLLALGSNDQFKTMWTIVHRTLKTAKVLEAIYIDAQNIGGKFVQKPISPTIIDNIHYTIQELEGDLVPHCDLRLKVIQRVGDYLTLISSLKFEEQSPNLIYIPVLRTSRPISGVGADIFENTILNQYFPKPPNKLTIETGYKLYDRIIYARNGSKQQIKDYEIFEKFIGETFFQSSDIHIVAHQTSGTNERNIKISLPNELDDVPMHHLGDGVQGVINLLFPLFTADEGSWIFIDEPETHLHPGYQNILIKTISENEAIRKRKLKIFINTHSNHILSGALLGSNSAEMLVFSRRDKNSSNIQTFNGNEYNTLEMLGVFNTSVLVSNCTLWVEGVTDRFYLQGFLYAFCNSVVQASFQPIEGLHFSFIEYGGKNLIHYGFDHEYALSESKAIHNHINTKIEAYFINANVFLLADSDFNKVKHDAYEAIDRSNFKYRQTGVPEVENLLPEHIIKQYLLGLKCDPAEVEACFPISIDVKLGEHLKDKISYKNGFRNFEADTGGTLNSYYKKGLADFVHRKTMDKTFKWSDFEQSPHLKEIIIALYEFIKSKNAFK